jgi:hypothetical protein
MARIDPGIGDHNAGLIESWIIGGYSGKERSHGELFPGNSDKGTDIDVPASAKAIKVCNLRSP